MSPTSFSRCIRRSGALLSFLVGLATCGACAGRYRPVLPLSARSGDVDLTVASWHPALSEEVVLRSHSQTSHVILSAWNTVATRAPCSGGASGRQIAVDSETSQAGAGPLRLPPGEHEIRVAFLHTADAFELDTVVDLELDDHACARVPAVSQDVPMRANAGPVVLGGTDLAAAVGSNRLLGLYAFTLGVGRWIGPTLITASGGIAGATCNPDLCGRTSDGSARAGYAFPFSLETRSLLHMFDGPTEMVRMLTAGARYSVMSVLLPTPGADQRFFVHGLQAVPGYWVGGAPRGPFVGGEHGAHMELSTPVGVVFDPSATSKRVAVTFGLGFRFVFPVL